MAEDQETVRCCDRGRLGVLGGAGEGERRYADDLRMALEGYEGR